MFLHELYGHTSFQTLKNYDDDYVCSKTNELLDG
jgi:hypothetical protein